MALASVPRLLDAGEAQHLPSLWIAHAEHDENVTRAMTNDLVAAYRRASGAVELAVFRDVGHGFAHVPGEATDRCIQAMRSFVAAQLNSAERKVGTVV